MAYGVNKSVWLIAYDMNKSVWLIAYGKRKPALFERVSECIHAFRKSLTILI
jgi:hypothetical protein